MRHWHHYLAKRYSWYKSWHTDPWHAHYHWSMFLAVSLIATSLISNQISKLDIDLNLTRAAGGVHDYFNALVVRPDHWKSYSLRPQAGASINTPHYEKQLLQKEFGGYADCNSCPLLVTYNPANDSDPHRQDAAKISIPVFSGIRRTTLAAAITSSETVINVVQAASEYVPNNAVKIDDEIMEIVSRSGNTITVKRGFAGTSVALHAAGTIVKLGANSLENFIRLPMGTSDGNTYFVTWDGYWTDSYLPSITGLENHKAFQFESRGIWLQTNTRFDGGNSVTGGRGPVTGFDKTRHIAAVDVRSYNIVGGGSNWSMTGGHKLGPGVTQEQPLLPQANTFIIKPNTWTRFWWKIEQRANDYDYVSLWVADENNNAVQIINNLPISVRPTSTPPYSIESFWLEFDTSTDEVNASRGPMVAYVRNVVMLKSPSDISSLLIRPIDGTVPPPPTPDTTSPFVSNAQPTGTLPAGITSTTLKVTTNEAATCKYSTVANTAYSSMTDTFSATGGTSHSTAVSGLANGNTYNYYVRCIDAAGNANINDYGINFSVASAVDTTPPTVTIKSPLNSAVITGTTVNVNYASSGGLSGIDHAHLQLDNNPEIRGLSFSGSYQFTNVPAGQHTVRGYLARADHSKVAGTDVMVAFNTTTLQKAVLTPSDFEYVGVMKVPPEITTFGWGGLTFRKVNGELRFFLIGHRTQGQHIFEINAPGFHPDLLQAPRASVIKNWGDVYQGKMTTSNSQGGFPWTEDLEWFNDNLYWAYGDWYNAILVHDPSIGFTTSNGTTAGPWRTTTHSQKTRSYITTIPEWYANKYTKGYRLAVGSSLRSGNSLSGWGPTLFAIPAPTATTPTTSYLETISLVEYDLDHRAEREPSYVTKCKGGGPGKIYGKDYDCTDWPVANDTGWWTQAEYSPNAAVWIDLPDKYGVMFFGYLGEGKIWYGPNGNYDGKGPWDSCGFETTGPHAERYVRRWWIYDPVKFVPVVGGNPWDVKPNYVFEPNATIPGSKLATPCQPDTTGTAFDPETRMLYVYQPNSDPATGIYIYALPAIYAFRVKDAATTPSPVPAPTLGPSLANHTFTSAGWATFGQVLPQGKVFDGLQVGSLPTQTDVKVRWPDSSIRFAVVTASIPSAGNYRLTASQQSSGSFNPTIPDASVNFNIAGTSYTATLPKTLSSDLWLNGPLIKEWRQIVTPTTPTNTPHPFLRVYFDTRVYNDGQARVDVTLENVLDISAADQVTYDVNVAINGTNVFSKSNLTHYYLARWRKTFGVNLTQSQVTPDFEPAHKAGAIPRYLSSVADSNSAPLGPTFELMARGGVAYDNMGAAGGRSELGPYPDWVAVYVVHKRSAVREYTLASGDLAGSWPIHIREANGSLVSIDSRPEFWLDGRGEDKPKNNLAGTGPLSPDNAHQPSLAYIPYLLTGDRYYADEMAFWANYDMLVTWPYIRGHADTYSRSRGLVYGPQVRGFAWALRNMVDAAVYLPDSYPYKNYFITKVDNNLQWVDEYANGKLGGPLGPLGTTFEAHNPGSGHGDNIYFSQWQNNYVAWTLDHALQQGLTKGTALRDRIAKFQLKLFTSDPDYKREYCCPYDPTAGKVVNGQWQYFTTMKEFFEANYKKPDGSLGVPQPIPGYYGSDARLSLMIAMKLGLPGAKEAYDWLLPQIAATDLTGRWAIELESSLPAPAPSPTLTPAPSPAPAPTLSPTPPPSAVQGKRSLKFSLEGRTQHTTPFTLELLHPQTKQLKKKYTLNTDSKGETSFDLEEVKPEKLKLKLKAKGYLTKVVEQDLTNEQAVTIPSLVPGDLNDDNIINSVDYSLLNQAWFKSDSLPDLNADGIVNSLDYSLLNKNWLTSGDD